MNSRRIDGALQGGGTHGAFAWGVVDRLLADKRIRFVRSAGPARAPERGGARCRLDNRRSPRRARDVAQLLVAVG
jgi:NTE family protein